MASILKKIATAATNTTTYSVGLLQAKAYRFLKEETSKSLVAFNISTTEWAFLGLLFDHKNGLRASDIAEELGVEAPMVSVLLKKLENQKLIEASISQDDSRSKTLSLSATGRTFVPNVEKKLKDSMRKLIEGASLSDILSYMSVLETIIYNSKKNNEK